MGCGASSQTEVSAKVGDEGGPISHVSPRNSVDNGNKSAVATQASAVPVSSPTVAGLASPSVRDPPRRMMSDFAGSMIIRGMSHAKTPEEKDLIDVKMKLVKEWAPEYTLEEARPPENTPDVVSERATYVTLGMVLKEQEHLARKTKIVCTMGPACWSEEGIGKLLDAGLNVARFNFSHGDHDAHGAVLERFRKVCEEKGNRAATLLDTKGPEIRTAMLRDGKDIELEAGQDIIVEAVGDLYTEFEGYKTPEETRIGLSYDRLCQSVSPGNRILLADGSLSIEVVEILNDKELRGKVLNSKKLGQRKNGNLPGVKVDIPVLTEKDIGDLQNFAAKNKMDFVAASFVQSAADVKFIRKTLDDADGHNVKIICKIENMEGLNNFDEILAETDGIMVARGDLGMEIPSEKVPVAQKMMITKCNIAGKCVICATQMLESMISNPRPTRAEMTDVANAVYDGTDAVMLSGETANGDFPDTAVSTMAAIVANAETGVDYYSQNNFIRFWATKANAEALPYNESVLSSAASMATGFWEDTTPEVLRKKSKKDIDSVICCLTQTGAAASLIGKYRPPCPIIVASTEDHVLRQSGAYFGQVPLKVDTLDMNVDALSDLAAAEICRITNQGHAGSKIIVAHGAHGGAADENPVVSVGRLSGGLKGTKVWSTNALLTQSGTPVSRPGTMSLRSTLTSLPLITAPVVGCRRTKVICTMGPKCWDEDSLNQLLDSGMDIIRLNFSHGDHKAHGEVLERFRKVCEQKSAKIKAEGGLATAPTWAALLDTKGPEIRTAMLKDGKDIELEAGQAIIVEAVGARYTEFEGYKNDKETRIGLSYDKLCQSVSTGNRILLADGSISIRVEEILSGTELRGTVLNSKKLGQRKNGNLPGVKVDIPVLTEKDIDDLQNFAAKNKLDYVAASFVQSRADVQFIRKVLDDAGGHRVKIISKIENAEGMINYDEILDETDGIMVARGDLGMEIPAEKVPLAQKMMITKANIAGKFVITATQMLESMITNPRPTRAEMTDVANAVLDGTDCVMLSGETANGDFANDAVSTMAAICKNAEEMVNVHKVYDFIRNQTPKPMMGAEAVCSGAVQSSIDANAKAIIILTNSGRAPGMVSKFRPSAPVFVVTPDEQLVRHCRSAYGQFGFYRATVDEDPTLVLKEVSAYAKSLGIVDLKDGDHVILLLRRQMPAGARIPFDDQRLVMKVLVLGEGAKTSTSHTAYTGKSIIFHRSTKMSISHILDDSKFKYMDRKTKIICTMGPACWSEEGIGKLLDAGLNIARFNFSHGDHKAHGEVLERFRKVCKAKNSFAATLLDTKGPEIRTAMLKDGKDIELEAGQAIIVEAVGDLYTEFEGYKNDKETRIGLSYGKLCQSVSPGNRILLADGSLSIKVEEILSETELRGTVMNSKKLGQRKNGNLPGVKVDIPVLTEKDIDDLQNFCAKNKMDYVAASFVQSKEDVLFIRKKLDEVGGQNVKIISKIENAEGLVNFDDILEVTDGIMVARGDLGMEIPVEKVPLAQKMMITKANIAGKFIVTATQMMESMITSPIPTRAEMTDVANAVFDGTDGVMLSGESANGAYPDQAVATMAQICRSAEMGTNIYQVFDYVRQFTPKPVSGIESVACAVAKNAVDMQPGMIVVFSENGKTARLIAKYRPPAPTLVVTSSEELARSCSGLYGTHPMLLKKPIQERSELEKHIEDALAYGIKIGICMPGKEVIVLTSTSVACNAAAGGNIAKGLLEREMMITMAPGSLDHNALGTLAPTFTSVSDPKLVTNIISMRSTTIDMDMLLEDQTPLRKTKIGVTIGPSSSNAETLEKMVDAGCDIARFKFSHSTPQSHAQVVTKLREICKAKNKSVAVLMDLQGPELRTSFLVESASKRNRISSIDLKAGDKIKIYGTDDLSEDKFIGYRENEQTVVLGVDLPDFIDVVPKGSEIRLNDGAITIKVTDVDARHHQVIGEVQNAGSLGERKVLNVSGVKLHSSISRSIQDMQNVQDFAVEYAVDFVAASQVAGRADVEELRNFLDNCGGENIKIIAKIETADGLQNIDEIIDNSDGIMIARGALGMAIKPEKVALAQKIIVTKCKIAGKPVIVARHLLESMNTNPRPTRAEMTDVANAVIDSADCVMLCSETSSGMFPVDSVVTAHNLCRNAEHAMNYNIIHSFIRDYTAKPFNSVEAGAVALAKTCTQAGGGLGLAIVMTKSGQTANIVSKYRPNVPVVVVSGEDCVISQSNLVFGQFGFKVNENLLDDGNAFDGLCKGAVQYALSLGMVKPGQGVCVMSGLHTPDAATTAKLSIVKA